MNFFQISISKRPAKFVLIVLPLLLSFTGLSQIDTIDPLSSVRNLISDKEIMLIWDDASPSFDLQQTSLHYLDYEGGSSLTQSTSDVMTGRTTFYNTTANLPDVSATGGYFGPGCMDLASGHLYQSEDSSATSKQSIITGWPGREPDGFPVPVMTIRAELPFDSCTLAPRQQSPGIWHHGLSTTGVPQVHIAAGNIMNDDNQASHLGEDEIAFAYTAADGKVYLHLYEPAYLCYFQQGTGEYLVPDAHEVDEIQGPSYNSSLAFSQIMDLACGDFDDDGYDEIALAVVHPDKTVHIHVYEYNEISGTLQQKYQEKVLDPNADICSDCANNLTDLREQIKLITGDIYPQYDGDEIVLGAYFAADNSEGSINALPLRENSTNNGFSYDLCSGCNTTCGSYDCNEGNVLYYRMSGVGSPDGMDRFDLATGDLEGFNNALDQEVVVAFNDQVIVLTAHVISGAMRLSHIKTFTSDADNNDQSQNRSGFFTQSFIDVGNMHSIDPGSGTVNLNDFAAEIVIGTNKVTFNPSGYPSGAIEQGFHIQVFQFPQAGDSVNLSANPTLIAERISYAGTVNEIEDIRPYALLLSDRDGGGISFGMPVRRDANKVITPVVILNAPPTHFDVFDDDTFDINNIYDAGLEDMDIAARTDRAIYRETSGMTTTFTSKISSDWAQSMSVEAGFEGYGASIGGKLTQTYGEKFEKISSTTNEISFEMETSSLLSDRVIGYEVDYAVYEYPVYYNGSTKDTISYVVVVIPYYPENTIVKDQAALDNDFQYNHQHGNLFSYAYDSDDLDLIGTTESYNLGSINIDNNTDAASRKVTFSTATTGSMSMEKSNQHSFEANAGFAFQGLSLGGSISGTYSAAELNTRDTEVSNTKEVEAYFEKVEQGLQQFDYTVTPYLFWDIRGAIVLDYTVDISNTSNDLFNSFYNSPDPAFLLPQVHDQEKGNISVPFESRRYRSKEVIHYPLAIPGRDITVFARVHNYGMTDVTSNIPVCFYFNTSTDETLQLIGCDSIAGGLVGRDGDFEKGVASFDWTIPLSLTASENPKIIAIIDPQNSIQGEVHDYPNANGISNNIAWNCLYGTDCADIVDDSKLFLDPCASLPALVTLNQNPIPTGTYIATDKVILSGIIPSGNFVTVKAPNGAEVMPTFEAMFGSTLEIQSGPCNE